MDTFDEERKAQWICSISTILHMLQNVPPGGPPEPDDQGLLPLCTRFALSKACASAFWRKKVIKGKQIDIAQSNITSIFLQETKVCFVNFIHQF